MHLAGNDGLRLHQSYARTGKFLAFKYGRYAHAKQFKRAQRVMEKMRTQLGCCVMRDLRRKIAASGKEMSDKMKAP